MIKVDAGKDLDMEDNTKKTGMEDGVVEENITEETAIENGEEDSAQEEAGKEAAVEKTVEQEQEEEAQEPEKRSFRKKNKIDKKQDAMKEKVEELEDKVKRQMAEFDNFRKRTDKEKTTMFEIGAKSVIEKILPVVDNFERGLAALPGDEKATPFAEGMGMVYKQLMTELDSIGVKQIEAVGTEFNPELHNAVMQVESEEYESGVVAQELQKGYSYRDSVVRHSMVAVVQ